MHITLQNLLQKIFQLLPRRIVRSVIRKLVAEQPDRFLTWDILEKAAIKSHSLRLALRRWHHSAEDLYTIRIEPTRVSEALITAGHKFPEHRQYILTDLPESVSELGAEIVTQENLKSLLTAEGLKVFVVAMNSDEKLIEILKMLATAKNCVYIPPRTFYPTARYFHRNDLAKHVLIEEAKSSIKKFPLADYEVLIECLEITRSVEGDYVEMGVYQGQSARSVLRYMKEAGINRISWLLDTYEGFTYESAQSSKDQYWANTHTDTSMKAVEDFIRPFAQNATCRRCNVIDDPLPPEISKIAICNIDVDMYEAVVAGLKKAAPLISQGGIIILEDQGHTPALAGGWLAAHEFTKSTAGRFFIPIHKDSGQMLLIRK